LRGSPMMLRSHLIELPCEIKSHEKGSWAEQRLFVIMIDP
jgi:hypothetical protein